MPTNFNPIYSITPSITKHLMHIEATKAQVKLLPLTPIVLASLRETAKLLTTHYSTMIEGNQLKLNEIKNIIEHHEHLPEQDRDENEVKGYYAALAQSEQYVAQNHPITEKMIQTLHALVMSDGRARIKPTKYRDGQDMIKDSSAGTIVYITPEAKDVAGLMRNLIMRIKENHELPLPHYCSNSSLSIRYNTSIL